MPRSRVRRTNEDHEPILEAFVAIGRQAVDVLVGVRSECHADRRNVVRGEAAPAEDDVDEASSDTAVAIHEWMDRLELSVDQSGLHQRGQIVSVQEGAKILEQRADLVLRDGDEFGGIHAVVASSDPVLRFADQPGEALITRAFEETPVDRADVTHAEGTAFGGEAGRLLHRAYVRVHAPSRPGGAVRVERGLGQAPM